MTDDHFPKKTSSWWPTSHNDNADWLPHSYPRYWCRACLALCIYAAPLVLFGCVAFWYCATLQSIGAAEGFPPATVQTVSIMGGVLVLAVGNLLGIIGAFWVLVSRSRMVKYVCRELL
ncbi:MAG: hypothetical protein KBE09_05660 [Candidatus Pacebacteria bacterium]|nr:hypothetical protein [Candidatus Paceibacterota bacterium]